MHSTSVKHCILQANTFLKPSMSPNHMFCYTKCIPGGAIRGPKSTVLAPLWTPKKDFARKVAKKRHAEKCTAFEWEARF